jgi:hypothetical protein
MPVDIAEYSADHKSDENERGNSDQKPSSAESSLAIFWFCRQAGDANAKCLKDGADYPRDQLNERDTESHNGAQQFGQLSSPL